MYRRSLILSVMFLSPTLFAAEDPAPSTIKDDEHVILFSTAAQPGEGDEWTVPIHGWIFEPESNGPLRRRALATVAKQLGLAGDRAKSAIFRKRAAAFLVDNERAKRIAVRVGDQTVILAPSGNDGHFRGQAIVKESKSPLRLSATAKDGRQFKGVAHLVGQTGVSVVSDIDDTIKISHVRDRQKLLEATFTQPFEAAPGMADFYRQYAAQGTSFHYVSSSPWQLYLPLRRFMRDAGYPGGSFHMKKMRLQDGTFLGLFTDPLKTKTAVIEPLMKAWPKRQFIFVGDSGEQDPEVYASLYRKFPDQVRHIYIRNVTDEDADAPRYAQVFEGIDASHWTVFTQPP